MVFVTIPPGAGFVIPVFNAVPFAAIIIVVCAPEWHYSPSTCAWSSRRLCAYTIDCNLHPGLVLCKPAMAPAGPRCTHRHTHELNFAVHDLSCLWRHTNMHTTHHLCLLSLHTNVCAAGRCRLTSISAAWPSAAIALQSFCFRPYSPCLAVFAAPCHELPPFDVVDPSRSRTAAP